MVGSRLANPRIWGSWGATCVAWCGLALGGNMLVAQEEQPAEPKPPVAAPAAEQALPVITLSKTASEQTEQPEERQSVIAAMQQFGEAFNAHQLEQVVGTYTEQAELTNQAGQITRGREAIHQTFTNLFTAQPQVKIQMEIHSIRFPAAGMAVGDGVSTMTMEDVEGRPLIHRDRYTLTLVKLEGKWQIAGARDWPPPPLTAEEHLQQLEWLIGEWVDENSDTLVHTVYSWSDDRRYLFSKYSVKRAGNPAVEGVQRIGWDPQLQQLHSWTYDSAGGFSEGLWSRNGDQWVIKLKGVVADGRVRSATNILTRLGVDHATYQSRDRVMGAEVLPDLTPVPIVRKPPVPELPKAMEPTTPEQEKADEQAKPAAEAPAAESKPEGN